MASTTSTEHRACSSTSCRFTEKTGIEVRVVAQGTGQALDTGPRGDADVVFVHAPAAEKKFVAEGFGVQRYEVMYNDFVVVGPYADPAGVKGSTDVAAALKHRGEPGAVRLARRRFRHPQEGAAALEGRRGRRRRATGISRPAPAWARR